MSQELNPPAPQRPRVRWKAEAALVVVAVSALGAALLSGIESRQTRGCYSRIRMQGMAMLQYNRDYDERYPISNEQAVLLPYSRDASNFFCPTTGNPFALHRGALGRGMEEIVDIHAPMFFESTLRGPNVTDDGSHWPATGVHRGGLLQPRGSHTAAFDGQVRFVPGKPQFKLQIAPHIRQPYRQAH